MRLADKFSRLGKPATSCWCDWIRERDEAFLAYIYVRLLRPSFDFGGTGLFFDDVEELASTRPWLTDDGLAKWPIN
jgi:hypothetical protein